MTYAKIFKRFCPYLHTSQQQLLTADDFKMKFYFISATYACHIDMPKYVNKNTFFITERKKTGARVRK